MRIRRITIIREKIVPAKNINDELQWIGTSLGLFNLRDKDSSCFRLFIELLKAAKENRMLSSDELAYRLNLSRGTVVHHINKMMEAGIIVTEKRKYALRVDTLHKLIDEIERDMKESMEQMRKVAEEIDKELGLK